MSWLGKVLRKSKLASAGAIQQLTALVEITAKFYGWIKSLEYIVSAAAFTV